MFTSQLSLNEAEAGKEGTKAVALMGLPFAEARPGGQKRCHMSLLDFFFKKHVMMSKINNSPSTSVYEFLKPGWEKVWSTNGKEE